MRRRKEESLAVVRTRMTQLEKVNRRELTDAMADEYDLLVLEERVLMADEI